MKITKKELNKLNDKSLVSLFHLNRENDNLSISQTILNKQLYELITKRKIDFEWKRNERGI